MACEGTLYDWSAIYFERAVHVPKATATLGFAIYLVTMTVGRFSGDYLANRFGVPRVLRVSGVLLAAGLGLAAAVPLVAGLGFVLVGLGISCVVPMVFGLGAGRRPTRARPSRACPRWGIWASCWCRRWWASSRKRLVCAGHSG